MEQIEDNVTIGFPTPHPSFMHRVRLPEYHCLATWHHATIDLSGFLMSSVCIYVLALMRQLSFTAQQAGR